MGTYTDNLGGVQGTLAQRLTPQDYYSQTPFMRALWAGRMPSWLMGAGQTAADAWQQIEPQAPWHNPDPVQATLDTMALPAKGAVGMVEGIANQIGEARQGASAAINTGDPSYADPTTNLALQLMGTSAVGSTFGNVPKNALGMNVWHGGPNGWLPEPGFPHGRPRLDKIGTGEGAQAYGHGFYTAENPGVAKSYQDAMKWRGADWADPQQAASFWVKNFNGNTEKAAQYLESASRAVSADDATKAGSLDALNWLREGKPLVPAPSEGALFKLDLPDEEVAKFLDWDKPLSEQSESVRVALDSLGIAVKDGFNPTGSEIHRSLVADAIKRFDAGGSEKVTEAASEALRAAGIPGLKYYDGMSRKAGEGTRNYVVWDQGVLDRTKILEKNGKSLAQMLKGDLPMDEASRMARAKEMGFDTGTPWYRGVSGDHPIRENSMWTTDPGEASAYSRGSALTNAGTESNVITSYMKKGKGRNIDAEIIDALEEGADPDTIAEKIMKTEGLDYVEFYHPSTVGPDDHLVRVVRFPKNIRSRFAKFDPAQKDSANLLASGGPGGAAAIPLTDNRKRKSLAERLMEK